MKTAIQNYVKMIVQEMVYVSMVHAFVIKDGVEQVVNSDLAKINVQVEGNASMVYAIVLTDFTILIAVKGQLKTEILHLMEL